MKPRAWIAIASTVAVLATALLIFALLNRGYGKVSPKAYQLAKALYSTCKAQDERRLDKVEAILNEEETLSENQVTAREKRWLSRIIQKARNGNWESAAKAARRMMEDQVER